MKALLPDEVVSTALRILFPQADGQPHLVPIVRQSVYGDFDAVADRPDVDAHSPLVTTGDLVIHDQDRAGGHLPVVRMRGRLRRALFNPLFEDRQRFAQSNHIRIVETQLLCVR